jgi:UDP-3-O-[3-hydroxymyristoyl] glucosamine N-acyltransferase
MKFTLGQIARILSAKLEGDPGIQISDLSKIQEGHPGSLSFLANPKYLPYIYTTEASAVIVDEDFSPKEAVNAALLRVKDPYAAFTLLLQKVAEFQQQPKNGIDDFTFIASDATVEEDVYIGAFSYISSQAIIRKGAQIHPQVFIGEGVEVGEGSIIFPHTTLYHQTKVGARCIIHAGACIGSDGFGFAPQEDGSFQKIPQLGRVVLENEVEIGANVCIDRATMGETRIKRGVKLDNLVQIAHNVEIGANSVIAAQSGIAGSTTLEENCMLGGQVGVVGHLHIAKGSKIDAQSGVNKSIKEPEQAFRGSPIQLYRDQLRSEMVFRKLADMYKRMDELEKKIEAFEK